MSFLFLPVQYLPTLSFKKNNVYFTDSERAENEGSNGKNKQKEREKGERARAHHSKSLETGCLPTSSLIAYPGSRVLTQAARHSEATSSQSPLSMFFSEHACGFLKSQQTWLLLNILISGRNSPRICSGPYTANCILCNLLLKHLRIVSLACIIFNQCSLLFQPEFQVRANRAEHLALDIWCYSSDFWYSVSIMSFFLALYFIFDSFYRSVFKFIDLFSALYILLSHQNNSLFIVFYLLLIFSCSFLKFLSLYWFPHFFTYVVDNFQ